MSAKTVAYSQLTMSLLMLPEHANPVGNVHGGEIMKLMDNTAGVVAQRHARTQVVTLRVDQLEFLHPIRIGNLVTCKTRMTFVGRSSMEVTVEVFVEDLNQDQPARIALTAYFTFVSLDGQGVPQLVPALELVTEEEHRLFEAGRQRYLNYKQCGTKPQQGGVQ